MAATHLFDLTGRVALVTGGGRGLGKAMAEALADAGADIVIMNRTLSTGQKAAAEIEQRGVRCLALGGDVSNIADASSVVERTVAEFGKLDILVNNAGISRSSPAEETPLEQWQEVIDVNLTGLFICAQAAGRQMIKQGKGRIINITSMSGLIVNNPQPQAAYNVSKAGGIMLTKSLAAEWARYGITVNSIAPGYMRTDMTAARLARPETYQNWIMPTPMRRAGEPDELGGAVVYLASDASSFMTGHTLVIDGGYTIW